MIYWIEPADYENVQPLIATLSARDTDEVMASTGHTPEEAITLSLALSVEAWVLKEDGVPACVFGVAPVVGKPGVGSPWLLSSQRFSTAGAEPGRRRGITRAFALHAPQYLRRMLDRFPLLENYVDARNEPSIRWLLRCGFTIEPAVPHGPAGLPFHPFYMERPDV